MKKESRPSDHAKPLSSDKNAHSKTISKKKNSEILELPEEILQNWGQFSRNDNHFGEPDNRPKFGSSAIGENKSAWKEQEDIALISLTKNYPNVNWDEISFVFENRNALQCQKRLSELNPEMDLIGGWGYLEQIYIFKLTFRYRYSWKKIVQHLPGRTTNSVKSLFNSTIRLVKKLDLLKFIKAMIIWPTYTNKSNTSIYIIKLLKKLIYLEQESFYFKNKEHRMTLLRTHLVKHFTGIMQGFKKLKRLGQEIIKYLLITDGEDASFDGRLINLIFGATAFKRFKLKGIKNELKSQKKKLCSYICDYLAKNDMKMQKTFSIFKHNSFFERKTSKEKMYIRGSERLISNRKSNKNWGSEIILQNNNNIGVPLSNRIDKAFIKKLFYSDISWKYVDHFIWLSVFCKSTRKIIEFKNLLKDAYF